jgi:predicted nucleic acid-binding protein
VNLRAAGLLSVALAAVSGAKLARLRGWRLHHASVASLVDAAWAYRQNMSAADALYVALAEHLGAGFLTDDYKLVDGPTFPRHVNALRLPARR